jgi:5'-nucleotidase
MKNILLTNDDGIISRGLWAAAEALSVLGFVHVTAPLNQYSGAGRSVPSNAPCTIQPQQVEVNGQAWTVYSIDGSPAQTVQYAMLEVLPEKPDLVVSGINYGENVGTGVTISGTVGAALEAAAWGIPALAVSLETDPIHHMSLSHDVEFSVAAQWTVRFARLLLNQAMPFDVDVLKLDVPAGAAIDTPWKVTRLSRRPYYDLFAPERASWDIPARLKYARAIGIEDDDPQSDAYTVAARQMVSVTPLSLDLTSRIDLDHFQSMLEV